MLESQSQAVTSSDFPATEFFVHLSKGSKFFRSKEYEKAILEWETASRLRPKSISMDKLPSDVSFRGNLSDVPLLGFFHVISSSAQTGVGIIRGTDAYKEVFFKRGWIVSARTNRSELRIGSFLLKRNLVTSSKLEALAAQAKAKGVRLGEFLVHEGLLTESELHELLEFQIKEILCDLFAWREGEFFFAEKEVAGEYVVVSYTPLGAALFAARRSIDYSTFRRMFPDNKTIFRISPSLKKSTEQIIEALDANEKFIFSLIDGNRNVEQLVKFSGNEEVSTINILHRLVMIGVIVKSKDIGVYEDKEFEEISRFLRTFMEVYRLAVDSLKREIGVKIKDVVVNARKNLGVDCRKVFYETTMNGEGSLDPDKVLKNIAQYYPDPSDRLVFIDGFHSLIEHILREMVRYVGLPLAQRVIEEVDRVRLGINRFYSDSPIRKKVLEALDTLVSQFSE